MRIAPNLVVLAVVSLASGAIDTYPREPIDVEHDRFAVTLADTTDRIEGVATVRMRLLRADIRTVMLDLADVTAA